MTKQAQVGLFAALAMLLLFGLFFVITDYGTRHSGYRIGVHFDSAAGLQSGSLVFFSGVTVGSVDVTLAIGQDVDIPRGSKFLIQAPLTGSPNLLIVPPKPGAPAPTPSPWERQVLPIADQPQGTNTATVADLMEQGQGEVKRLDALLASLEEREPKLLDTLQHTLESANSLTNTANASVIDLSTQDHLAAANVLELVNGNTGRINNILAQLDQMSVSLNKSTQSLQGLATNQGMKDSLIATTKNIADTTQTISDLTKDLRTITGNPETQAQLRDTISNVDAAAQRTTSAIVAPSSAAACR